MSKVPTHLSLIASGVDDEGQQYRIIRFIDEAGLTQACPIPISVWSKGSTAVFEFLAQHGYCAPLRLSLRSEAIGGLDEPSKLPRVLVASKIGWHGRQFILPGDGSLPTDVYCNFPNSNHRYQVSGTLRQWLKNVVAPAYDNPLPMFCLMAAFAGPLLHLVNGESGGFQFVAKTSTGKTSCGMAGGSAWGGGGPNGFAETWLTTSNALDDIAALHRDTFLILDETGLVGHDRSNAKVICDATYRLASGQGKRRKTDDAQPPSWRILYISTSEHDLVTLARRAGLTLDGGQRVRHVDIMADAGRGLGVFDQTVGGQRPADMAQRLKENALTYYGAAGRALVAALEEALHADEGGLKTWLGRRMDSMLRKLDADQGNGMVVRIAQRFAIVYAAGCFAAAHGILPWSRNDMRAVVTKIFARVNWAGVMDDDPVLRLARTIKQRRSGFVDADQAVAKPPAQVLGFLHRRQNGRNEYLIKNATLEGLAGGAAEMNRLVEELGSRRLLITQGGGKSTATRKLPGRASERFFCIAADIDDLA